MKKLVEHHVVAQQELIEVVTVPGHGTGGIAELDGMALEKRNDQGPSDFSVPLLVIELVSFNGLAPAPKCRNIQ